jgi:hypothetical protein
VKQADTALVRDGRPAAAGIDATAASRTDTLATERAETLAAERTDTLLAERPGAGSADPADAPAIPSGEASLRGDGGIQDELGGFTLVLGMNVQREPMDILVQKYVEKGYRADIVTEQVGSTTLYRAAIGHFPTASDASAAADGLRETVEENMEVAPLRHR